MKLKTAKKWFQSRAGAEAGQTITVGTEPRVQDGAELRSSEWVAPLEAALRDKAEAWRKYSQERIDEPEALALYEDMTALKRVIEILRSRGATAKLCNSPEAARAQGEKGTDSK